MNTSIKNSVIPLLLWVLSTPQLSIAENNHPETTHTLIWQGSWHDGEGGTVFIQQHGRILDVTGKDAISVYTMRCLLDGSLTNAKCQGQGRQLTQDRPFLYQTWWRMYRGSIIEKWNAEFENDNLSGELIFKKASPEKTIP